ncbi:MAG: CheR family methyltransferase [Phycisphaerales bacterium]
MRTLDVPQFQRIAAIARERWGLSLTQKKLPLVSNRLASFLRGSDFTTIDEYLDHLETSAEDEDMLVFFDVLSTNVTSFFRDPAHFDYLEREFYTPLARGNLTTQGRKVRIWSAACSTGQEPYSLAMQAIELLPDLAGWDMKILGTDLSNYAVSEAQAGRYPPEKLDGVPAAMRQRHFRQSPEGGLEVTPEVRRLVTIARMNLMDPWPFKGKFEIIFCRNVMIYFDAPTRRQLVMRFHGLLRPGGILAIGSAETLAGLDTPFAPVQASVYVKE